MKKAQKEMLQKAIRVSGVAVLGILAIVGGAAILRGVVSPGMPMPTTPFSESKQAVPMFAPMDGRGAGPEALEMNRGLIGAERSVATDTSMSSGDTLEMPQEERKVMQTGSLDMRVSDADAAVRDIRGVAEWYKGHVLSVNVYETPEGMATGSVTVKVPVSEFLRAMEGIKELGTIVIRESISGRDVTEQYVDLEARLANKRAEEEAFQSILETADDTEGVIQITRELARVRGEIEQMEARKRYLDSQTDMSTITVSISEDQKVTFADTWRPWQEVKEATSKLLGSLQGFASGLIVFVVWFVPMAVLWLVILGGIFLIGRKMWKRNSR